ncbi:hypothetical protein ACFFQF_32310 [Haladaptatus pallidirubidus]|nr:hypothetical protein [Haladaptatus pallidirubidus]
MSDSSDGTSSMNSMHQRAGASQLKIKILLEVNRWVIVGGLAASIFVTLVLVGTFGPAPIPVLLQYQDPIDTLFQGLVSGVITGVTLILTINQLVLSQELDPIGTQRERMKGALSFRQDLEDATALAVSPAQPSTFLRALIEAIRRKAITLEDAMDTGIDGDMRDEIEDTVDGITDNAEEAQEQLTDSQFGTFNVLGAALGFNYSRKVHDLRRLRNLHSDSLPDEVNERLNDLLEVIKFFGPAREHIKTLYFRWELIDLSRAILYAAIPSLTTTFLMILFYNPREIPGEILGVPNTLWLVSLAVAITILPFLILLSYILRIATVAKRTLAIGPFVLRTTDRNEEIEWEDDFE